VTDSELEQFKAKHVIPSEETNESWLDYINIKCK
jgi:hypothetical protein